MLRRTALILTGFLFLALVVTIGYAMSGLGGPQYTLHRARQALQAREFAEAIRLTNVALSDRALDTNVDLRRDALRVRYQALSAVGDYGAALADLGELIEKLRDSDVALITRRIQILLDRARINRDMSEVLSALERAKRVLEKAPKHSRALALAGDACRIVYENEISKLQERLARALPPRLLRSAMERLTESTFRANDDARVAILEKEILTLLPDGKNQHHELRNSIRGWVQRAEDYFLRALRLKLPHIRAYLGADDILRSARRDDQRMVLAEIYMQRANPKDAISAAAVAAKLHLDKWHYRACIAMADRVLAPQVWRRLADLNELSPDIVPLLLCKHLALSKLSENDALEASSHHAHGMATGTRLNWRPLFDLTQAIALAETDTGTARFHLDVFCAAKSLPEDHWTERQLLRLAYEKRVEVERRAGTDPKAIAAMLLGWSKRDRGDRRPLILRAKLYLEADEPQLALAAAGQALDMTQSDDTDDADEDVLRLYAETAVAMVSGGPRDLPNLVQHCRTMHKTIPDTIGDLPILVLPLAEYALGTGDLDVAAGCARLGAQQYAWARWPRYLLIEAALQSNRPADATQDLDVLLKHHPGDRRANELLSRVLQSDPKQTKNLRYSSPVHAAPNLATARLLARQLYARSELDRVLAVTRAASVRGTADLELMSLAARVLLQRGDSAAAGHVLAAIHRMSQDGDSRSPWALGEFILWNPTQLHPAARVSLLQEYLRAESRGAQVLQLAQALRSKAEHGLADHAASVLVTDKRFTEQRTGAWFQLAGRTALQMGHLDQARAHLVAATGFGDGKAAALDLTLLHLARDDLAAARQSFVQSLRDTIAAACVAGRLGENDTALTGIRQRLAADPRHLPTLCMLACLDPKAEVPAEVRKLAQAEGDDLLELLAFLSAGGFEGTSQRRATALAKKHQDNPVAVLLAARAFVQAGQDQGVLATLAGLGPLESPILEGEVLRILSTKSSPKLWESDLMKGLVAHVVAQGAAAEPALLSLIIRHDKRLIAANGNAGAVRRVVLKIVADYWIRHPDPSNVGLDEVDMLVDAEMHKAAQQLCEVLEQRLPERDRPRFLRTFYANAAKVVAADPVLATPMMTRAMKVLMGEGVYGAVLHFLLDTRDTHMPLPADPDARQARLDEEIRLLRTHVNRYHAGKDPDRHSYLLSLGRLFRCEDPTESLDRMEARLQQDPSLIDVWGYRARRLVQSNRLQDAIDGLAWIPSYLTDPTIDDILVSLRLRRGGNIVTATTPDSALARGLLALRDANFDAAVEALKLAEAQVDGSHLFYLALAHLGKVQPLDRHLAMRYLDQLSREYPDSPVSHLAAEFAEQLAAGR